MTTCGNVVYFKPGNDLVSGYCGLAVGHTGPCKLIPEEAIVQVCKQILIDRGEVVIPLRGEYCRSLGESQRYRLSLLLSLALTVMVGVTGSLLWGLLV